MAIGRSSMSIFQEPVVPNMLAAFDGDANSGNYTLKLMSDSAILPSPFGNGSTDTFSGQWFNSH